RPLALPAQPDAGAVGGAARGRRRARGARAAARHGRGDEDGEHPAQRQGGSGERDPRGGGADAGGGRGDPGAGMTFDYEAYVADFLIGDDEALVERWFAEDCAMESGSGTFEG